MPENAIVTGSRAYGEPRKATAHVPPSDLDLVVKVSGEDLKRLQDFFAECKDSPHPETMESVSESFEPGGNEITTPSDGGSRNGSFRFGPLNLIVVTDELAFDVWKDGCEFLKTKAPVPRDKAVKYYRKKREKAGLVKESEQ